MRRMIRFFGLLALGGFFLLGCQKEELQPEDYALLPDEPGRATIELFPAFDMEILQESGIVPMTRAQDDLILTRLNKNYKVIIIKKMDHGWVVDTLITGELEGIGKWEVRMNVYAATSLPAIRLALRPGTYKAGFFLNANEQNWNPDIKPGFVVSEKEEITPEEDLPYAYTYLIQKSSGYLNYNQIMLNDEPFAGWTSFTVQKNDTLQQTGPIPRQTLTLKRKATRFRYLLKHTEVQVGNNYFIEFEKTAHFLRAQFKVAPETPFCQGLNILGGGYYPRDSLLTSVMMNISTTGLFYTSPVDRMDYQMCTPINSTYYSYYLLMDDSYPAGLDCEITDIYMSGQSDRPTYAYNGSINRRFWLNRISGVVFELTPEIKEISYGIPTYYIKEITDADAVGLFGPYFELNPK